MGCLMWQVFDDEYFRIDRTTSDSLKLLENEDAPESYQNLHHYQSIPVRHNRLL